MLDISTLLVYGSVVLVWLVLMYKHQGMRPGGQ